MLSKKKKTDSQLEKDLILFRSFRDLSYTDHEEIRRLTERDAILEFNKIYTIELEQIFPKNLLCKRMVLEKLEIVDSDKIEELYPEFNNFFDYIIKMDYLSKQNILALKQSLLETEKRMIMYFFAIKPLIEDDYILDLKKRSYISNKSTIIIPDIMIDYTSSIAKVLPTNVKRRTDFTYLFEN